MRSGAFEGCAAPQAADKSHLAPAAQELYSDNEPLMTPVAYGIDDAFGRTALLGGCQRSYATQTSNPLGLGLGSGLG